MIEYVCTENERDRSHLVGKTGDEMKQAVKVAPAILSKYVGGYEFKPPERPGMVLSLNATLDGENLMLDIDGGVRRALTPVSETKFFMADGGVRVEFLKNDKGEVTTMMVTAVEGDFKALRKGVTRP
jgi:hypothetical protein